MSVIFAISAIFTIFAIYHFLPYPLLLLNLYLNFLFWYSLCFYFMFYSFNYTVKSGGVCNRLPTLYRDRHLEGSEIVTWRSLRQPPYILTCRSILPADHRSHFSYLLPHHIYLLRVYIELLELYLQLSRLCISTHCKAHRILLLFTEKGVR
jgi:hypothetical protein